MTYIMQVTRLNNSWALAQKSVKLRILLAARWQIAFLCFYLLNATLLFSAPGLHTLILQEIAINTMLNFQINNFHLWSNY